MAERRSRNSKLQIWIIPIIVAAITAAGLFFALTGDGQEDYAANIALAFPAILAAVAIIYSRFA